MDEIPRTSSTEPSPADTGKWIGCVLIAVILGEGLWGLIVSLTNNLLLPLLARVMVADAKSPLYLGKGDINVPALFTSVLELCFAAMVAVILNSWVQRRTRPTRSQAVSVRPIPAQPAALPPSPPTAVPVQAAASVPPPAKATASAPSSGQFWSAPELSSQAKATAPASPPAKPSAKPEKPKPAKEIYYNIVGEPINPTEGE
jgi:hypothetical protein